MKYRVTLDRGVDITREGVTCVPGEAKRTVTAHYEHGETVIDPPNSGPMAADNMVKWGHLEPLKDEGETPFVGKEE